MNIETTIILAAALCVGEIAVSLLARRYLSSGSQLKLGEELMNAINRARQDVIAANELITQMEAVNIKLRQDNQQLSAENMRLENLAAQLKAQLNIALDDIDYWQHELRKAFPNWPDKSEGQKNNN